MQRIIILAIITLNCQIGGLIAQNVGLNTQNPTQSFEMVGSGVQYMRLHNRANFNKQVGLELVRGVQMSSARDWRILKQNDDLIFLTSEDNFQTYGSEAMRFKPSGKIGIGVSNPSTKLHITGGEDASNTEDGFITLGNKSGLNMVISNSEIIARNNGSPSWLQLQNDGGNTYFGYHGLTNTLIPQGNACIGTTSNNARLNLANGEWQLQLNNWELTQNNWFIGATDDSWVVGDDQLIFSPTTSSDDAMFRLMDVAENDGQVAPVIITSSSGQTLLLDGNEIDSKATSLNFNYNSEEDVYVNPAGGKVGIGTSNPIGKLHLKSSEVTDFHMVIQNATAKWQLTALGDANLYFYNQGQIRAYIHRNGGGAWVQVSDRKFKENITPLKEAMAMIRGIDIKRYSYSDDPDSSEDIGVIAQEVQKVIPEAVFYEEGQYGVNYDQLTCVAVEGVKEHQVRLDNIAEQLEKVRSFLNK